MTSLPIVSILPDPGLLIWRRGLRCPSLSFGLQLDKHEGHAGNPRSLNTKLLIVKRPSAVWTERFCQEATLATQPLSTPGGLAADNQNASYREQSDVAVFVPRQLSYRADGICHPAPIWSI